MRVTDTALATNESALDFEETEHGQTLVRRKQLGDAAGGDRLGCSLYELPAGRRAWPYHYHENNEEAIYVLAGTGTIRLDDDQLTIEAGDYVALPAGPEHAHRVVNDSDSLLRYLAISTMDDPDVLGYPDSGKLGVYTGSAPGDHDDRRTTAFFPEDADVDFWTGEE